MKFSRLVFLGLATMLSPFAMAGSAPPDKGLLITRINSEQWEVRLISGSQAEQSSLIIDSDLPYTATSRLNLASTDSAKLLTPTSLGASLRAAAGGVDGVNFSVSPDAKLCVRDTGSSGVQMYLGDSLRDAIPVPAPVALTSADACGDVLLPAANSASSGRKNHRGHYVVMAYGADSQALMATAVQPGVVGLMKRYTWRSLEPSQGAYQFGAIKSDLAWAASRGMQLIVMIDYKSFFTGEKHGPAYLDRYEGRNTLGGFTMELWSPAVYPRYNALTKALGAQVDGNKNFEGIATQESSTSMSGSVRNATGYTPQKYRDALISMLTSASASLPSSRVFWYMNFLEGDQSYIGTIASAVAPQGVIMGGPDVWPDNKSLQNLVYPYYSQFAGKMPLFGQVENSNYAEPHMTGGHRTKYWTMLELYSYAVTRLHVNYMFWVRVTRPANSQAYDWTDALPVIAGHPNFN